MNYKCFGKRFLTIKRDNINKKRKETPPFPNRWSSRLISIPPDGCFTVCSKGKIPPSVEGKPKTENTHANNSLLWTGLQCFETRPSQEYEKRNNDCKSGDENARDDTGETNIERDTCDKCDTKPSDNEGWFYLNGEAYTTAWQVPKPPHQPSYATTPRSRDPCKPSRLGQGLPSRRLQKSNRASPEPCRRVLSRHRESVSVKLTSSKIG